MLFPLTSSLFAVHQGKSGGRGLSPRLWAHAFGQGLSPDGLSNATMLFDDFTSFGGSVSSTTGTYASHGGSYKSYQDTSCTIQQRADKQGGSVRFSLAATDNNEANLRAGYDLGNVGKLSRTAGANFLTIFEARFLVGQITNLYDFFVGLGQETFAITQAQIDAGGAVADLNFIGFRIDEAAGSTLTFTYKKAGQTVQVPTGLTNINTMVADTFVKVGFVYDPSQDKSKRIKIYVDNTEQATYITDTLMAAATFPLDVNMNFTALMKNASGATKYAEVDWYALMQVSQ